jgi:hydrogenase maturation protease
MSHAERKVVLGLGNTLNSDEGVGVQALALVAGRLGADSSFEALDGGTLGLNLLPLVEECSHLLLLDAVNAGASPGTVVELKRDEIPLFSGIKMSEHQITFQEVLGLADMRGKLPPFVHLIGVQPADLSIGLELSAIVKAALPDVVERAMAVLQSWATGDATTHP